MTVAESGIDIRKYWDEQRRLGPECRVALRKRQSSWIILLNEAVRDRLMSEVPLGTFCSGGVDSSLVTAIAARIKNDRDQYVLRGV